MRAAVKTRKVTLDPQRSAPVGGGVRARRGCQAATREGAKHIVNNWTCSLLMQYIEHVIY